MNILLIEDNEDDKLILEEILFADIAKESLQIPIQLDWAQTLHEAQKLIKDANYDIALLDLSLPDSQGIKSIQALQELNHTFAIIVITGNEAEHIGVEAVRLGADDYLIKGQYHRQSLLRSMHHAIERRKIKTELAKTQSELLESKLAAESANDAKTVFLAMMSHEFRTPLQNMLGFLNLLEDTPLNQEQREYLNTAIRNLDKLEVLVDDIVDYSKVEKGTMAIAQKPFSPTDILQEAVNLVTRKMPTIGPAIATEVLGDIPQKVIGDAGRLLQVLTNLLTNAKKFTPQHKSIGVSMQATQEEQGYRFNFTVSDTGCGISEEDQALLFVPFKQVNPDKDQAIGGTGLGLAICQRLCYLMHGNIKIKSQQDVGTDIYFDIFVGHCTPIQASDLSDNVVRDDSKPRTNPSSTQRRTQPLNILVAEDDPDSGSFLIKQLEKLGHEPHLETNGQDAVNILSKDTFDIVLMDVRMPVMNGHEAAQAIRNGKAGKGEKNIPIIGISANTSNNDIQQSLDSGMNAFVPKPIRISLLDETIQKTFQETHTNLQAVPATYAYDSER